MRLYLFIAVFLVAGCRTAAPITAPALWSSEELARLEERRLDGAGFEPLETVVARGLEVQRVDFNFDMICCQPSVQLTRAETGTVMLTFHAYGHRDSVAVEADRWMELASQVRTGALAPPDPVEVRRRDRGPCHTWHDIEASLGGQPHRLTASRCLGGLQARALSYVETIALDTLPRCQPWRANSNIGEALNECGRSFGPPDPAWVARRRSG
jgi:hypothetical protein